MSQNPDFFTQFLNNELPVEAKPTEKKFTQSMLEKNTSSTKIKMDSPKSIALESKENEIPMKEGAGVSIKTDEKYEHFINPNKKRNQIIAILSATIILLAIILYLIFGNKVEVPDFSIYTPSQIATWATKNNIMIIYMEEYHNDLAKGTLISQDIEPGKKIKKGSDISLIMSLGIDPEVVVSPLPSFDETWTTDDLSSWIKENYLMNATIKQLADETIERNHFIKMDLETDELTIQRKTKITFYVSTGSPYMVKMIDLKSKTETEVKTWAQKNDITVVYEKVAHDTIPENQIITQSIKPEIEFNPKTEILTVEVSSGPGILVPNLTSMTMEEIKIWANKNEINLMLTEKYHNSIPSNTMIDSSISMGDLIKKGDFVTLTFSLGKVGIKNFIGDTEISFMEWIDEQNLKGANLTPSISYQYIDLAEKNRIVAQSLYDRRVETGSTIQIVVNLGGHLTVPALTGLPESEARQNCQDSGLMCVFTYDYSNATDGTIASQDRQAGYNASEGDIINLIISKGPRP